MVSQLLNNQPDAVRHVFFIGIQTYSFISQETFIVKGRFVDGMLVIILTDNPVVKFISVFRNCWQGHRLGILLLETWPGRKYELSIERLTEIASPKQSST